MSETKVTIKCEGLFIRTVKEVYQKVTAIQFTTKEEVEILEIQSASPIVITDTIPKSFPGDAIRVFETKLSDDLFEFSDCLILCDQKNTPVFVYNEDSYIVANKTLYKVLSKEDR